jgi:hypothetical protein
MISNSGPAGSINTSRQIYRIEFAKFDPSWKQGLYNYFHLVLIIGLAENFIKSITIITATAVLLEQPKG